jgi:hypothetical protein
MLDRFENLQYRPWWDSNGGLLESPFSRIASSGEASRKHPTHNPPETHPEHRKGFIGKLYILGGLGYNGVLFILTGYMSRVAWYLKQKVNSIVAIKHY